MFPAHDAVRLAAIAYEPFTAAEKRARALGYRIKSFFDVPPAQGYLFERGDLAVLAFRGTEASRLHLWDIASNVRFLAHNWEGPGGAHLGYVRQYRRLREPATHCIKSIPTDKPLFVTGHSMGGAMATVSAADVFERGWKIKRLITFGAPKALDAEAAAAITCPVDRYVNAWDPAPPWPPSPDLTH